MIDITFKIGGTDYSGLLSTYNVDYAAEYGESFTALDGTEYGRPVFRPIITFSLMPLTEAQTAALFTKLSAAASVTVQYTDPHANTNRTASFRVASDLNRSFLLKSIDGLRRYSGGEIVLRQRTVL
jgi:hypothetical protein